MAGAYSKRAEAEELQAPQADAHPLAHTCHLGNRNDRSVSDMSHAAHIRKFNSLYSSKIEQDDANGILLNEAVRMRTNDNIFPDPWSGNHDDDQGVFALFQRKSEELEESRKRFLKYLSEDQKIKIANSANATQAILSVVDTASFDWCRRSESGSAIVTGIKKKFHQVCKSLDQHKDLFSILPKDSEYVSVFYGAFNSIIAASVMHQAMATGLPKIVDELNAIIKDVAEKMKLYPQAVQQMKRVVMELYTRIFDLLAKLMKWYTKNHHQWKIMKKDCYSDFESALQDIRNWVNIVEKGVLNNLVLEIRRGQEETRNMTEILRSAQEHYREDMLSIAKNYLEMKQNTAIQQAEQRAQFQLLSSDAHVDSLAGAVWNKIFRGVEVVGAGQAYILASMADTSSQSSLIAPASKELNNQSFSVAGGVMANQKPITIMDDMSVSLAQSTVGEREVQLRTREEVEINSRRLDEWYPEGHLLPMLHSQVPAGHPILHESIASRLLRWTKDTESTILCIQLPYDQRQRSVGSKIASHVVSSAYEVDFPIISYFCTLPRNVEEGRIPQTAALCELLVCMTRQLVTLLPDDLPEPSTVDLTAARFDSLDGTLRTWDSMLGLFADLLSLVQRRLLIVIHGMQCLNNEYTTSPIQDFLAVLRKRLDSNDTAMHTTKILFVIEGQCFAVVPWLQRGEHVLYGGDRRLRR